MKIHTSPGDSPFEQETTLLTYQDGKSKTLTILGIRDEVQKPPSLTVNCEHGASLQDRLAILQTNEAFALCFY